MFAYSRACRCSHRTSNIVLAFQILMPRICILFVAVACTLDNKPVRVLIELPVMFPDVRSNMNRVRTLNHVLIREFEHESCSNSYSQFSFESFRAVLTRSRRTHACARMPIPHVLLRASPVFGQRVVACCSRPHALRPIRLMLYVRSYQECQCLEGLTRTFVHES